MRKDKFRMRPLLTGKLAVGGQNVVLLFAVLSQKWSVGGVFPAFFVISAVLTLISAVAYARALKGIWSSSQMTSPEQSRSA